MNALMNGWVEIREHVIKCGWKMAIKSFSALHHGFATYMQWHSRALEHGFGTSTSCSSHAQPRLLNLPTAEENNIYIYTYMLERQVGDKAPTLLDPFDVRVWASAFSFQHSAFSIPP